MTYIKTGYPKNRKTPWKNNWRYNWRSYEDAKKFVHSLNLKSKKEWAKFAKSKKKPEQPPRHDGTPMSEKEQEVIAGLGETKYKMVSDKIEKDKRYKEKYDKIIKLYEEEKIQYPKLAESKILMALSGV